MDRKIIILKDPTSRPMPGSRTIRDAQASLLSNGWGSKNPENDEFLMNSDKLLWHKERLLQWARDPENASLVPLHIDMGVTTGCNLACTYCYGVIQARTGFQGKQGAMRFMSYETMNRFFSDCDSLGVKSIALIGECENTLNPSMFQVLERARDLKLEFSLATHGASIKSGHMRTLLSSLTWLRVNISAGTKQGYMRVHQRPWFDRVIESTTSLLEIRDKEGILNKTGEKCTVGWQMVVDYNNFDEIIALSNLAREVGVDYLVIKACSDTPDGRLNAPSGEYVDAHNLFDEAEALSNDVTKIIARWEKLGNGGNKIYSKCFGTRFIIAVSGNGNVFPCGHWFDIEKDRFLMGNINERNFSEIVASDRYKKVQQEILGLDLRQCETNCRQHQVNIRLENLYLDSNRVETIESSKTLTKPRHVNFI